MTFRKRRFPTIGYNKIRFQYKDYRSKERFKNRQLQALVATDVAARGIDVNDITHVINYELPDDPEVYTHRSGRILPGGLGDE